MILVAYREIAIATTYCFSCLCSRPQGPVTAALLSSTRGRLGTLPSPRCVWFDGSWQHGAYPWGNHATVLYLINLTPLFQDAISNAAQELGLLSVCKDDAGLDPSHLFLVQMPAVLPISQAHSAAAFKPSAAASSADAETSGGVGAGLSAAGRSGAASSSATTEDPLSVRGCAVRELPSGSIGRLLVYRSGKVKLKIGEVLMDVMPGLPCKHRIDVSVALRFM